MFACPHALNSYIDILMPDMRVFEVGVSGRCIVNDGGALLHGIRILMKGFSQHLLPCEATRVQPGSKPSINHSDSPILDVQPPEL